MKARELVKLLTRYNGDLEAVIYNDGKGIMKNTKARYEVVAGTRTQPGEVLAVFEAGKEYRCGGPATACLRSFERMHRNGVVAFFRKVS